MEREIERERERERANRGPRIVFITRMAVFVVSAWEKGVWFVFGVYLFVRFGCGCLFCF